MNNNELNIFEIMGEEDPKRKKGGYRGTSSYATGGKKHSSYTNGQEQRVSDPFFQDAIERVFSQNPSGPRLYSDGEPVPTYKGGAAPYSGEKAPRNQSVSGIRGAAEGFGGRIKQARGRFLPRLFDSLKGGWREIAAETVIVLLAVVFVYHFVISISHVSGDSMNPAFCDGDRVLILRLAKGSIEKGDVIVFETAQGEKLMKRVVATEGDTVDISKSKGGLYVNGEAAEETNIYTVTSITDENVTYPITVNEDCYFVLGDNRTNSKDSRNSEIGLVQKKDIMGKVVLNIRGT